MKKELAKKKGTRLKKPSAARSADSAVKESGRSIKREIKKATEKVILEYGDDLKALGRE